MAEVVKRIMYVPIAEVREKFTEIELKEKFPKYAVGWGPLFSTTGRFDKLLSDRFGSKQHVVVCEVEMNPDGTHEITKPIYDMVVEEDGPVDPKTGLVKSPSAIVGLVVRKEDGYYILVQSETRPVIRNHNNGKWGQTGNPVVIEHTLPGGFGDWGYKLV